MRMAVLILSVLLLGGCVTESTGKLPKTIDKEKQLQSLVDLGVGYLRNGDYGRAKENLNKALTIDPKSSLVHNTLAVVFQLEKEFDIAEVYFKNAIKYDPTFTRARNNYGAFLFERGRHQEAIDTLLVASEDRFYGNRSSVFENLGVAYQKMGNEMAAEEAYARAVALNPEQVRALLELANIRFEQRRYVEARELFRRYERVAPKSARSVWLCVRLAKVFENSNDEASCALALKNIFPASDEYKLYQEMIRQ